VVHGSVFIRGKPLDEAKKYKLAVKAYMALGKDGFDCLLGLKVRSPDDDDPAKPCLSCPAASAAFFAWPRLRDPLRFLAVCFCGTGAGAGG